jgi:uncharacterized protein (DUF58 family)
MDAREIIRKVQTIELKTRGLTRQVFSGEYHSAFKGRGMSFSEVREYQHGDEVRTIDWNVTARLGTPYVKLYEEERELTVMLVVDISRSVWVGTFGQSKRELITELCAILAFSAILNNDKVGLVLFDSDVRLYLPPRKARTNGLRIIRELVNARPQSGATNLGKALEFVQQVQKRRAVVFVLSDFLMQYYQQTLQMAARRHDVIGWRILDNLDRELPDIGLVKARDIERGEEQWLDTGDKATRKAYEQRFGEYDTYFSRAFRQSQADHLTFQTGHPYRKEVMQFFKQRAK